MSQSKDISEDVVVKYLESPDFLNLSPDKKKEAIGYLKTRMQRSAGGVPDTGGNVLRQRENVGGSFPVIDPEQKSKFGQAVVGAGRAFKGLIMDTPEDIVEGVAHPSKVPGKLISPHVETFKKARAAANEGKLSESMGYSAATALPGVGPMAAHFGETIGKGKWAEALGEATVYWLTDRLMRGSQRETTGAQRLSAASGSLPEYFEVLAKDMAETSKTLRVKPKTVGELADNLKETNRRITSEFNLALQPIRGRQRVPNEVATKLMQEANKFDTHTPEGMASRQYLRRRAVDYMKPWTMGELDNKRRLLFDSRLEAKAPSAQMSALKASDEVLADKIIEDSLKDIVYGDVQAANPGKNIRLLKEKESRLIDVRTQLKKQIDDLTQGQSEYQAMPFSKKVGASLSAHTTGVTPRVHGLMPKSGPLDVANKQVKRGFPSPGNKLRDIGQKLRIQTIKNYPISALYGQSQKPEEGQK